MEIGGAESVVFGRGVNSPLGGA